MRSKRKPKTQFCTLKHQIFLLKAFCGKALKRIRITQRIIKSLEAK